MTLTGVELKLESKDPLLARVWHNIELILIQPCMLESAIYGHVDELVLLSFSCSGFACGFKLCVKMPEYCDCCGNCVWLNGKPEVWEETWEPAP
jgi:hypothetical protein